MELPKASLLSIHWTGKLLPRINERQPWTDHFRPMYLRLANGATLHFPLVTVSWRMPWLPRAVYNKGWNEGFTAGLTAQARQPTQTPHQAA